MDFARRLFGGSEQEHKDFVDCYQQGPRAVSGEEAAARYQQVAPNLPSDVYQRSAQDVFSQMSPEQLGQRLIQPAREQGHSFPDVNQDGIDDRSRTPSTWRGRRPGCTSSDRVCSARYSAGLAAEGMLLERDTRVAVC